MDEVSFPYGAIRRQSQCCGAGYQEKYCKAGGIVTVPFQLLAVSNNIHSAADTLLSPVALMLRNYLNYLKTVEYLKVKMPAF